MEIHYDTFWVNTSLSEAPTRDNFFRDSYDIYVGNELVATLTSDIVDFYTARDLMSGNNLVAKWALLRCIKTMAHRIEVLQAVVS
jgi:hypothetical protein